MCLVIYLALIGLLLLYSVSLLDEYMLAVISPDQPLMVVAQSHQFNPRIAIDGHKTIKIDAGGLLLRSCP